MRRMFHGECSAENVSKENKMNKEKVSLEILIS
jgi:hypothetical protein